MVVWARADWVSGALLVDPSMPSWPGSPSQGRPPSADQYRCGKYLNVTPVSTKFSLAFGTVTFPAPVWIYELGKACCQCLTMATRSSMSPPQPRKRRRFLLTAAAVCAVAAPLIYVNGGSSESCRRWLRRAVVFRWSFGPASRRGNPHDEDPLLRLRYLEDQDAENQPEQGGDAEGGEAEQVEQNGDNVNENAGNENPQNDNADEADDADAAEQQEGEQAVGDDQGQEEQQRPGREGDDYFDDKLADDQLTDDDRTIIWDDFYAFKEDWKPPNVFPLTTRKIVAYILIIVASTLGASGGIGGGGIVVPVYILVMALPLKVAVPISAATCMGGGLGSTIINMFFRRHPLADRPLIVSGGEFIGPAMTGRTHNCIPFRRTGSLSW